jgi:hypothetical protein
MELALLRPGQREGAVVMVVVMMARTAVMLMVMVVVMVVSRQLHPLRGRANRRRFIDRL